MTAAIPEIAAYVGRVADGAIARGVREYRPRWEDTPLLSGLLAAAGAGGDSRYLAFVVEWLRLFLERPIAYGRRGDPDFDPQLPAGPAPRLGITDFCGSWGSGYVALQAYRATGEQRFRDAGVEIARYVHERGPRLLDGGLEHYLGNGRLWVDTLYYCAPLLALAGAVSGDAALGDEAALQCLVHARYLQNPETGCFYHNYEAAAGRADTTGFWGRGNGWIAMSLVDTLAELPPQHPQRRALLTVLERHFAGLLDRQHATGLWRVVLDHPDAYLETSGSAMIGYAMARAAALRLGSDHAAYGAAAGRAWRGLSTYVLEQFGRAALMGAQAPSSGGDWERHKRIAVGEHAYATGPFLMLGACVPRGSE